MITAPLFIGAFIAGVLMFLAPCTLPIVPGYLAFIGGARGLVMRNAVAFVLGFSVIFVLLGASAGLFGIIIGAWRWELARVGGALIILFGLTMLGVARVPLLSGERHFKLPAFITAGNPSSSALLGALFALGWSPCIGPILGTILLVASGSSTAAQGALLLAIFSAGLAAPFLLMAAALSRAQVWTERLASFTRALSILGALFLILLGVLMLLGQTGLLVSWGYGALDFVGYSRLLDYL